MAKKKLRRIKQQPGIATKTIKHFLERPNDTRKVNRHKLQLERSPGASFHQHLCNSSSCSHLGTGSMCFLTPEQLKQQDKVPKTNPIFRVQDLPARPVCRISSPPSAQLCGDEEGTWVCQGTPGALEPSPAADSIPWGTSGS